MSSKLSALADLAGGQVPTDLLYIDDVSAGAAGSKKSTLNDLISIVTKNITDGALRFGEFAAPGLSVAGQGSIYYDATLDKLMVSENGGPYVQLNNVSNFFTSTNNGNSITNTVTETSFFNGVTGSAGSSLDIPANSPKVGTVFELKMVCAYATNGAGQTGRFRIKLDANTVADTGVINLQNVANALILINAEIQVTAIGAAGAVFTPARFELGSSVSGVQTLTTAYSATTTGSIDFTVAETVDMTFQWGAASAANVALLLLADMVMKRRG